MNINLRLRLYTDKLSWLCFKHAVEAANRGEEVKTDIDEFGEYYGGPTYCVVEECDST